MDDTTYGETEHFGASKRRRENELSVAGKNEKLRGWFSSLETVTHDPPADRRASNRSEQQRLARRGALALAPTAPDVIRRSRSVERDELTRQTSMPLFLFFTF